MRSEHPSVTAPAARRPGAARRALAACLLLGLLCPAGPAAAESAQLQALREQLRQAEQLNLPELAPMVASLREFITTLENEERAEANRAPIDTAGDISTIGREDGGYVPSRPSAPSWQPESRPQQPNEQPRQVVMLPPPVPVQIRKSHFTEIGKPAYERCPKTGQAAIDNLCPIAMIRYQNYLAEAGGSGPRTQEYWTLHEQTAIVYLAALEDFAVEPNDHVLAREPYRRPGAKADMPKAPNQGTPPRFPYDAQKQPPCVKSNPKASCVTPQ